MKTHKVFFLLVTALFLMPALPAAALDFETLTGTVYNSTWGPVYLLNDSNGEWIIVYTYSGNGQNRYGLMYGTVTPSGSTRNYDLEWAEYDDDFIKTASGTAQLAFKGGLSFSGVWQKADGSPGGNWSGTYVRDADEKDLKLVRKILRALMGA